MLSGARDFARMRKILFAISLFVFAASDLLAQSLPFSTVFKGQDRFQRLVSQARQSNWRSLPIGDRTAAVGKALIGIPYKNYTLEIDDHIEAPSVNLNALIAGRSSRSRSPLPG